MTMNADDFLMGGGGKYASFKAHGDQVWGEIVRTEVRQQTKFGSGALMFWDDGNPRMQLVVTLQTELQDDEHDDGLRNVYVKGQMQKAVQDAVLKAGERGLRNGGKLLVRYTGDEGPKDKGMSPTKLYFSKYEPPVTLVPTEPEDADDDTPF